MVNACNYCIRCGIGKRIVSYSSVTAAHLKLCGTCWKIFTGIGGDNGGADLSNNYAVWSSLQTISHELANKYIEEWATNHARD